MIKEVLLCISIILLTGLIFSKLAKKLRFPNVTGYLIGGLIIGPSLFTIFGFKDGIIAKDIIQSLSIFSNIALGFIAFGIGSNFKGSYFKRVGNKPVIIAVFESLGATLFVFLAVLLYGLIVGEEKLGGSPVQLALILSAIASATAPAATVLVIKQYKARGEVTENLLAVVAIDDAVALIIYGIASAISNGIDSNSISFFEFIKPVLEIAFSLGIGLVLGIILTLLIKWFTGRGNRITCVIAVILLALGIQILFAKITPFELSSLLMCMMIGAVFVNVSEFFINTSELIDRITPPLYILFFVLSGADLNLKVIVEIGIVGLIYIITRVVGKWIGALVGSKITKAGEKTAKYLGPCLIPQAGVALALSQLALTMFPGENGLGIKIRTIILAATLVYELIGPFVVKLTLTKAGEIKQEPKLKESTSK